MEDRLYTMLKGLGLPVAYRFFKTRQEPPFIVYLLTDTDNFGADNQVYNKANNYQVELYSDEKDVVREKSLEDLFTSNDFFYEKTETYIESEGLYEVLYEIQM